MASAAAALTAACLVDVALVLIRQEEVERDGRVAQTLSRGAGQSQSRH
jgi:hypothetical protein